MWSKMQPKLKLILKETVKKLKIEVFFIKITL